MRNILTVGILLIFAIAFMAGCNPAPPPTPPPATPTAAPATEAPKTEAPKAEGIEYLKGVSLHFSPKEKPAEADVKEMTEKKAPEGTMVVILKMDKNEAAPEDKELEVGVMMKDAKEPLSTQVVASKDLKEKDVLVNLEHAGKAFEKGEYVLVVKEVGSTRMMEEAFVIEGAGEVKDEEHKDEEHKEEPKKEEKPE